MSDGAIETLSQSPLFAALNEPERRRVGDLAQTLYFDAGHILIRESDIADTIYLIMEGRVDVHVSIPGSDESEVVAKLRAGEIVGELILLGRERRSAKVVTRDRLKVLCWKKKDLLSLFEKEQIIGYKIMTSLAAMLADRLIATNLAFRNVLGTPRHLFV